MLTKEQIQYYLPLKENTKEIELKILNQLKKVLPKYLKVLNINYNPDTNIEAFHIKNGLVQVETKLINLGHSFYEKYNIPIECLYRDDFLLITTKTCKI